jgi:hypothetical protein
MSKPNRLEMERKIKEQNEKWATTPMRKYRNPKHHPFKWKTSEKEQNVIENNGFL